MSDGGGRAATSAATLAVLGAAAACLAQPLALDLRFDEPAVVEWTAGGQRLSVAWLELADSRCPVGAVCVWEGEVAVLLAVEPAGGARQELTLRRQYAGDERATAAVAGYWLRLEGVDPHPAVDVAPERAALRAHLTVAPPGSQLPAETAVGPASWARVKRAANAADAEEGVVP